MDLNRKVLRQHDRFSLTKGGYHFYSSSVNSFALRNPSKDYVDYQIILSKIMLGIYTGYPKYEFVN